MGPLTLPCPSNELPPGSGKWARGKTTFAPTLALESVSERNGHIDNENQGPATPIKGISTLYILEEAPCKTSYGGLSIPSGPAECIDGMVL